MSNFNSCTNCSLLQKSISAERKLFSRKLTLFERLKDVVNTNNDVYYYGLKKHMRNLRFELNSEKSEIRNQLIIAINTSNKLLQERQSLKEKVDAKEKEMANLQFLLTQSQAEISKLKLDLATVKNVKSGARGRNSLRRNKLKKGDSSEPEWSDKYPEKLEPIASPDEGLDMSDGISSLGSPYSELSYDSTDKPASKLSNLRYRSDLCEKCVQIIKFRHVCNKNLGLSQGSSSFSQCSSPYPSFPSTHSQDWSRSSTPVRELPGSVEISVQTDDPNTEENVALKKITTEKEKSKQDTSTSKKTEDTPPDKSQLPNEDLVDSASILSDDLVEVEDSSTAVSKLVPCQDVVEIDDDLPAAPVSPAGPEDNLNVPVLTTFTQTLLAHMSIDIPLKSIVEVDKTTVVRSDGLCLSPRLSTSSSGDTASSSVRSHLLNMPMINDSNSEFDSYIENKLNSSMDSCNGEFNFDSLDDSVVENKTRSDSNVKVQSVSSEGSVASKSSQLPSLIGKPSSPVNEKADDISDSIITSVRSSHSQVTNDIEVSTEINDIFTKKITLKNVANITLTDVYDVLKDESGFVCESESISENDCKTCSFETLSDTMTPESHTAHEQSDADVTSEIASSKPNENNGESSLLETRLLSLPCLNETIDSNQREAASPSENESLSSMPSTKLNKNNIKGKSSASETSLLSLPCLIEANDPFQPDIIKPQENKSMSNVASSNLKAINAKIDSGTSETRLLSLPCLNESADSSQSDALTSSDSKCIFEGFEHCIASNTLSTNETTLLNASFEEVPKSNRIFKRRLSRLSNGVEKIHESTKDVNLSKIDFKENDNNLIGNINNIDGSSSSYLNSTVDPSSHGISEVNDTSLLGAHDLSLSESDSCISDCENTDNLNASIRQSYFDNSGKATSSSDESVSELSNTDRSPVPKNVTISGPVFKSSITKKVSPAKQRANEFVSYKDDKPPGNSKSYKSPNIYDNFKSPDINYVRREMAVRFKLLSPLKSDYKPLRNGRVGFLKSNSIKELKCEEIDSKEQTKGNFTDQTPFKENLGKTKLSESEVAEETVDFVKQCALAKGNAFSTLLKDNLESIPESEPVLKLVSESSTRTEEITGRFEELKSNLDVGLVNLDDSIELILKEMCVEHPLLSPLRDSIASVSLNESTDPLISCPQVIVCKPLVDYSSDSSNETDSSLCDDVKVTNTTTVSRILNNHTKFLTDDKISDRKLNCQSSLESGKGEKEGKIKFSESVVETKSSNLERKYDDSSQTKTSFDTKSNYLNEISLSEKQSSVHLEMPPSSQINRKKKKTESNILLSREPDWDQNAITSPQNTAHDNNIASSSLVEKQDSSHCGESFLKHCDDNRVNIHSKNYGPKTFENDNDTRLATSSSRSSAYCNYDESGISSLEVQVYNDDLVLTSPSEKCNTDESDTSEIIDEEKLSGYLTSKKSDDYRIGKNCLSEEIKNEDRILSSKHSDCGGSVSLPSMESDTGQRTPGAENLISEMCNIDQNESSSIRKTHHGRNITSTLSKCNSDKNKILPSSKNYSDESGTKKKCDVVPSTSFSPEKCGSDETGNSTGREIDLDRRTTSRLRKSDSDNNEISPSNKGESNHSDGSSKKMVQSSTFSPEKCDNDKSENSAVKKISSDKRRNSISRNSDSDYDEFSPSTKIESNHSALSKRKCDLQQNIILSPGECDSGKSENSTVKKISHIRRKTLVSSICDGDNNESAQSCNQNGTATLKKCDSLQTITFSKNKLDSNQNENRSSTKINNVKSSSSTLMKCDSGGISTFIAHGNLQRRTSAQKCPSGSSSSNINLSGTGFSAKNYDRTLFEKDSETIHTVDQKQIVSRGKRTVADNNKFAVPTTPLSKKINFVKGETIRILNFSNQCKLYPASSKPEKKYSVETNDLHSTKVDCVSDDEFLALLEDMHDDCTLLSPLSELAPSPLGKLSTDGQPESDGEADDYDTCVNEELCTNGRVAFVESQVELTPDTVVKGVADSSVAIVDSIGLEQSPFSSSRFDCEQVQAENWPCEKPPENEVVHEQVAEMAESGDRRIKSSCNTVCSPVASSHYVSLDKDIHQNSCLNLSHDTDDTRDCDDNICIDDLKAARANDFAISAQLKCQRFDESSEEMVIAENQKCGESHDNTGANIKVLTDKVEEIHKKYSDLKMCKHNSDCDTNSYRALNVCRNDSADKDNALKNKLSSTAETPTENSTENITVKQCVDSKIYHHHGTISDLAPKIRRIDSEDKNCIEYISCSTAKTPTSIVRLATSKVFPHEPSSEINSDIAPSICRIDSEDENGLKTVSSSSAKTSTSKAPVTSRLAFELNSKSNGFSNKINKKRTGIKNNLKLSRRQLDRLELLFGDRNLPDSEVVLSPGPNSWGHDDKSNETDMSLNIDSRDLTSEEDNSDRLDLKELHLLSSDDYKLTKSEFPKFYGRSRRKGRCNVNKYKTKINSIGVNLTRLRKYELSDNTIQRNKQSIQICFETFLLDSTVFDIKDINSEYLATANCLNRKNSIENVNLSLNDSVPPVTVVDLFEFCDADDRFRRLECRVNLRSVEDASQKYDSGSELVNNSIGASDCGSELSIDTSDASDSGSELVNNSSEKCSDPNCNDSDPELSALLKSEIPDKRRNGKRSSRVMTANDDKAKPLKKRKVRGCKDSSRFVKMENLNNVLDSSLSPPSEINGDNYPSSIISPLKVESDKLSYRSSMYDCLNDLKTDSIPIDSIGENKKWNQDEEPSDAVTLENDYEVFKKESGVNAMLHLDSNYVIDASEDLMDSSQSWHDKNNVSDIDSDDGMMIDDVSGELECLGANKFIVENNSLLSAEESLSVNEDCSKQSDFQKENSDPLISSRYSYFSCDLEDSTSGHSFASHTGMACFGKLACLEHGRGEARKAIASSEFKGFEKCNNLSSNDKLGFFSFYNIPDCILNDVMIDKQSSGCDVSTNDFKNPSDSYMTLNLGNRSSVNSPAVAGDENNTCLSNSCDISIVKDAFLEFKNENVLSGVVKFNFYTEISDSDMPSGVRLEQNSKENTVIDLVDNDDDDIVEVVPFSKKSNDLSTCIVPSKPPRPESEMITCKTNAFQCSLEYWHDFACLNPKPKTYNNTTNKDLNLLENCFLELIHASPDDNTLDKIQTIVSKIDYIECGHIADIIVDAVYMDCGEADIRYTPPAPPLTPLQRRLLILLVKLANSNQEFFLTVLKALEEPVVSFVDKHCITKLSNLVQFHTALCKHLGLLSRSRAFLYDILYCKGQKIYTLVFSMLPLWIEILPSPEDAQDCLLTQTIVYMLTHFMCHHSKGDMGPYFNSLKQFVDDVYEYNKPGLTKDSLCNKLVANINKPGANLGLVLLCKREEWEWASKVMENKIHPIIKSWLEGRLDEETATQAVLCLGRVVRGYPMSVACNSIKRSRDLLEAVLKHQKSVDVTEAAVSSICMLRRHDLFSCSMIFTKWWPADGKITKNMADNIKTVLSAKQLTYWKKFLLRYS